MKKYILLVLCLILSSFVVSGCGSSDEPWEEKSYTPDMQIHEINIDVRDREIEVSLSDDDQIHIMYYENSKEYYDISVSDNAVLSMTSESNKEWTDFIGGKPAAENRKIRLQVPDTLVENLTLSTTNEKVTLSSVSINGTTCITSNGGDIAFESLHIGSDLMLDVKNGDISGTLVGDYDDFSIRSEIKKGESNLPENIEGGEKTLTVSSNNGDVEIGFVNESID